MKKMDGTYFIYIADVFCPWCYAFAPVMKKLAGENPDIPVRVLGGNLISRPMTLAEDAAPCTQALMDDIPNFTDLPMQAGILDPMGN